MNSLEPKSLILVIFSLFILSISACKPDIGHPITERITMEGITLPEGFSIEKLYSPGVHQQGSWVSITKDDKGRLYTSDQFGTLYRVTLPNSNNTLDSVQVEKIDINFGMAQGLLWHDEVLYAVVNASNHNELGVHSGFYKITDSDNDDHFDKVTLLRTFYGDGEHGPHNIELAPDEKSLYIVLGNHTEIPGDMKSTMPKNWGEDNLLPVIKDPSGHANDVKAPGGWVVKTDFDGIEWTIVNVGLRNTYDIAFNRDGELFGFDSDMEYDMGMPWYRPIRLCHLTAGGDFGWRTGTGKFASEYPDNLSGVANLGQGSPTGLLNGTGLKFPTYYQNGLYLFDWSYGTMYFASLKPKGSSYTAEITEFLSGVPLPLTNGVVGDDGALYFLTGGRELESALYKLTYTGKLGHQVKTFAENKSGKKDRALRHRIERLQTVNDQDQIDFLLEHLDTEDRHMRFSARVALENQDIDIWKDKISEGDGNLRKFAIAIAVAHQGVDGDREKTLNALLALDWDGFDETEKTNFLRAIELLIQRTQGEIETSMRQAIRDKLLPYFLKERDPINKQLIALLSYMDTPEILEPTIYRMEQDTMASNFKSMYLTKDVSKRSEQYGKDVENMLKNMPNQQHISYAKSLSVLKTGWTKSLRERYFRWYNDALKKSGGKQYANFIKAIQRRALDNVPENEREYFESLSTESMNSQVDLMKDVTMPKGPGKNYVVSDVVNVVASHKSNANFESGANLFRATLCISCHSMKGLGGSSGPDLSQVGNRFSVRNIAEAIIEPSKTVSDRYRQTIYHLDNGNTISGRLIEETDDHIEISVNAFSPDITSKIRKESIVKTEEASQSAMPAGLINGLNEKELADLIAFLVAGGKSEHAIYRKD